MIHMYLKLRSCSASLSLSPYLLQHIALHSIQIYLAPPSHKCDSDDDGWILRDEVAMLVHSCLNY